MSTYSTSGLIQVVGNEPPKLEWPEATTVRMQPRDETAERQAFERARRLVESYGWTVTAPETMGCESIGPCGAGG